MRRHPHPALAERSAGPPRILLYSHDSYGLGHLSRTLAIASAVLEEVREARVRILTGCPVPEIFPLPPGCSLTRLDPITKDGAGRYVARDAGHTPAEVHARRARTALRTAVRFDPDLFLADHVPGGAGGELRETLGALGSRRRCRIVFGMRDILDAPRAVRRRFREEGSLSLLRSVYETILVYGDRRVFDAVEAYGFPPEIAAKVRFTGYLGRGFSLPSNGGGGVLVTPGGGEDGADLLEAYLRDLRDLPHEQIPTSLLVAGPLLPPGAFRRLEARAAALPRVRLRRFLPGLQREMASADLVVCRSGYNTLCEALSLGRRVLVVPRSRYRKEQPIRARILSRLGVVDALTDTPLPPGALVRRVLEILRGEAPPLRGADAIPLNGLSKAASFLAEMLGRAGPEPALWTLGEAPPCASSTS